MPPGLAWEDEQVINKALSIAKFPSIIYFKMLCESKYNTKQSAHWNHNPLFILRGLVVPLWHKHAHHVWAITSYLFQELLWRRSHVDRAPMSRVFCSPCLSGEWSSCPAKFQQDVVTTDETVAPPSFWQKRNAFSTEKAQPYVRVHRLQGVSLELFRGLK